MNAANALSRHLDRGLIKRFNFQRDCAIHKTATIWGLMLKYFLSFKSIFCQAKIQAEKDAEIQAKEQQCSQCSGGLIKFLY